MSKKPVSRKTDKIEYYRVYRINAPAELASLYDQLQCLENKILGTRKYRTRLLKLNPRELRRGDYWLAVRDIIRPEVRKLSIKNRAWYSSKQHPVTGEIGMAHDREIRFESGMVIDRDLLASLNLAQRSLKKRRRNQRAVKPVRVARVRDKHTSTPRRAKPSRKTQRFPLIKQVSGNTFKINEGRGIIVASLPVQRTPSTSARDRWAARMVAQVNSNMTHRVTPGNSSELLN